MEISGGGEAQQVGYTVNLDKTEYTVGWAYEWRVYTAKRADRPRRMEIFGGADALQVGG